MSSCMIKNCKEKVHEEGFCTKHYNEIIKKVNGNLKKEYSTQEKEEISTKAQFFLHSLLIHVDKFTSSLVTSFSNLFNLSTNETAEVYRQVSNKLIQKSDNKKVIPILKKIVQLKPNDTDSKFQLGSAYLSERLYEKAIDCFEDAIKLNPDNHNYYFKIGLAYEQNGHLDEAISSYNKALKVNPDDSEAHYRLGVIYDDKEEYEEAIALFTKSVELNPKQASYYNSLGYAYESLDQHKDAVKCYKKAVSLQNAALL